MRMDSENKPLRKRLDWLDVLRFLGIFGIFIVHFGSVTGRANPFLHLYVTPLFIVAAGFSEAISSKSLPFGQFLHKKIKGLLLPYFVFSLITLVVLYFTNEPDVPTLLDLLKRALFGVRNQLYAPALWFLPCLFIMSILFWVLRRFIKNKWIILGITAISFGVFLFIPFKPYRDPSWFWNLDSALYYFIYYGIGFAFFEPVKNLLENESKRTKLLLALSWLGSFVYSAMIFFGRNLLRPILHRFPDFAQVDKVIYALVIIWFNIGLAKYLEKVKLFQDLGRLSLYLCGSETIAKLLVQHTITLTGLTLSLTSPLSVLIYTALLFLLSMKLLIPGLKFFVNKGNNLLDSFEPKPVS